MEISNSTTAKMYFSGHNGVLSFEGLFESREEAVDHVNCIVDGDWAYIIDQDAALEWVNILTAALALPEHATLKRYFIVKDTEIQPIGSYLSQENAEDIADRIAGEQWEFLADEDDARSWLVVLNEALVPVIQDNQLSVIVYNALNTAIAEIQQHLGENTGDFAGIYFSDDNASGFNTMLSHLKSYAVNQKKYINDLALTAVQDSQVKEEYVDNLINALCKHNITMNTQKFQLYRERVGALCFYIAGFTVYATPLWEVIDFDDIEQHKILVSLDSDDGFHYNAELPFPLSFSDQDFDEKLYLSLMENNINAVLNSGRLAIESERKEYESKNETSIL